jgi:hypothetical protein
MAPTSQVGLVSGPTSSQPSFTTAPGSQVLEKPLPSASVDSKLAVAALGSMSFALAPTDLHLYAFANNVALVRWRREGGWVVGGHGCWVQEDQGKGCKPEEEWRWHTLHNRVAIC